MAAAGVELAFDMTHHSVIGVSDALKKLAEFKRLMDQLVALAVERKPDFIICVDFSGFNRRFGHAVKQYVRARRGPFNNWSPKLVQYVSPQVWASRPGRAWKMARNFDLLLCILPFEKAWYARRVPNFPVEFVGHPIVERHCDSTGGTPEARLGGDGPTPELLLLPGSRVGELKRHLPPMIEATRKIHAARPDVRFRMVLPAENLRQMALAQPGPPGMEIQIGGLSESLAAATVAIASTGTVTLECALFGVPTVALYKTSWSTYWIARNLVTVKYLAMPNLLADAPVFPEFIQGAATGENLARTALDLLDSPPKRAAIRSQLAAVVKSLGNPGASERAARAIRGLGGIA